MQVGQLFFYPPILGCELSCLERGVAVALKYGAICDSVADTPFLLARFHPFSARESPA